MVPTLVLGVPGSATTAVILGALVLHGIRPGPHLFDETPEVLYLLFLSMLTANLMFLALGLAGAKLFAQVTRIPTTLLWPAVLALAGIGSYALAQSVLDMWLMVIFAGIGFLVRRHGFAAAPLITGLVPGEPVENSLEQSLVLFDGAWWRFFERPIVVTFFAFTALALAAPLLARIRAHSRPAAARSVAAPDDRPGSSPCPPSSRRTAPFAAFTRQPRSGSRGRATRADNEAVCREGQAPGHALQVLPDALSIRAWGPFGYQGPEGARARSAPPAIEWGAVKNRLTDPVIPESEAGSHPPGRAGKRSTGGRCPRTVRNLQSHRTGDEIPARSRDSVQGADPVRSTDLGCARSTFRDPGRQERN
jgi:hypothetical protein